MSKTLQDLLHETREKIEAYHKLSKRKQRKRKNWDAFIRSARRVIRIERLLKPHPEPNRVEPEC